MKGLIITIVLAGLASVAAPSPMLAYKFGSQPLDDVIDAAYSHNKCRSLPPEQLIAYMLAPTWWEVAYERPSANSVNVPSPMTLSRNDAGEKLFPPGQSPVWARYHRVFWHTGIGAWQLDDSGLGIEMGPQKFDTRNSANRAAEEISERYCDGRNIFGPWVACRTRGTCDRTAKDIYNRIEELVKRDPYVDRMGGAEPRACRFAGLPSTVYCLYIDPLKAQGYKGEIDGRPYGWISAPGAKLPLAAPFYVFTLEEGREKYEVRYWLAEKTGFDRDFAAKRNYTVSAKDGLRWIDNPRLLCDVTGGLGSCNEQSNLAQFRSNGTTTISVGGSTNESTVRLRGFVSDPSGQQARLEIELRRLAEYGGGFTGESTQASAFGASGRIEEITVYGLVNGRYHWRARTVNAAGERTPWVSFGGNSDDAKDFTVALDACSPSSLLAHGVLKASPCGGLAQITAQSALDIGETSATLKADVIPNGSAVTAFFEYGVSTTSLTATPPQTLGSDFITREVGQSVTGLTCGTTFYFRTVATNGTGRSEGSFQDFRTGACSPLGAPPQVTTQPATEFGPTSVTLRAIINPNGSSTSAFFEHGITTSVLTSTGVEQIGTNPQEFSQFETGLTCDTQYFYRVVAANNFGRVAGAFLAFRTAPCPQQTCFLLTPQRYPVEGGDVPLVSPGNSVGCAPGRYNPGEQVRVTARPAPGWTVRNWFGTLEENSSLENTVSMSSYDHVVWVYYRPPCERSFSEPSGGNIWKKGEPHTIKWNWGGCGQTVQIQLIKETVLHDTIATLPATVESYTWTPALWYENGSKYQIKVVDASDPSILILTHFFTLADP